MDKILGSTDFLEGLAYLIDMTKHLNELNLKLQGKDHTIAELVGHVNNFRSKSRLFKVGLGSGNLTYFATCRKLVNDFKLLKPPNFSRFSQDVHDIID